MNRNEISDIFRTARRNGSLRDSVLSHGMENSVNACHHDKITIVETDGYYSDHYWINRLLGGIRRVPSLNVKILKHLMGDEDVLNDIGIWNPLLNEYNIHKEVLDDPDIGQARIHFTNPATLFLKWTMSRDDMYDLVSMEQVSLLKAFMIHQFNNLLAKHILVGDRSHYIHDLAYYYNNNDDYINAGEPYTTNINDDNLRSIAYAALKNSNYVVEEGQYSNAPGWDQAIVDMVAAFDEQVQRGSKYMISSSIPPTDGYVMFIDSEILLKLLQTKDSAGSYIYKSARDIADRYMLSEIIPVPALLKMPCRNDYWGSTGEYHSVYVYNAWIMCDLGRYYIGYNPSDTDYLFDDFDLDYNRQHMLFETRVTSAYSGPAYGHGIKCIRTKARRHNLDIDPYDYEELARGRSLDKKYNNIGA